MLFLEVGLGVKKKVKCGRQMVGIRAWALQVGEVSMALKSCYIRDGNGVS